MRDIRKWNGNSVSTKTGRVAICVGALVFLSQNALAQLAATGVTGAHDPSTLTQYASNGFIYFATGTGTSNRIVSRTSSNMVNWKAGPSVFATAPAWTTTAVPGATNFWAPDVSYFDGVWHLYYAVSTFGSQVSGIGMATSASIDPTSSNYGWVDQGPVIQSTTGSAYNTIDPSILVDTNGSVWMSFGSYWDGIYITQINPATGMRLSSKAPAHVAYNSQIEASYLYQHDGYYYLFVNFGMCCMGVNSTYNIRVGRSTSIAGPYLDENGVPMLDGGGTLLLGSEGKYIGPGQVGIMDENNQFWMSYHYYDGNNNGNPTYALEQLYWTGDNWPSLTAVPEPVGVMGIVVLAGIVGRRRSRIQGFSL